MRSNDRGFLIWTAAAVLVILTAPTAAGSAQMRDPSLGSRALTDADLEKYVDIIAKVRPVARGLKGDTSPAAAQKIQQATAAACAPHDWSTLDYGVVNARVTVALQHLKMEKTVPVPAEKKAEVELVRKWKEQIDAARKD